MRNYEKHGMRNTKLYYVWQTMKLRCNNKNYKDYDNYGGRNIKICTEWNNLFISFYNWSIKNGYEEGLTIDRMNNNGNYEPSNCEWVTMKQNTAVGKRRMPNTNKSGYVGVCRHNQTGRWQSSIKLNGKCIFIGLFDTVDQAVKTRIEKEIELFGERKTNLEWIEGRG